jgi:hypothetical protein
MKFGAEFMPSEAVPNSYFQFPTIGSTKMMGAQIAEDSHLW